MNDLESFELEKSESATDPTWPTEPTNLLSFVNPVKPAKVSLQFPTDPSVEMPTIPSAPGLSAISDGIGNVTLDALLNYIVPETPVLSIGTFSETAPTMLTVTPVQHLFSIDSIDIFGDSLVSAIKTKLQSNIQNGGTGLSESVETAIWQRDLERNEQQLSDTIDKEIDVWAKKGFSLPDGLLAHQVTSIQSEYMNKLLDRSREIAIKQAELEQINLFKSLETGSGFITKLFDSLLEYDKLILACQDFTAKYANEYIRLQIEVNNNLVDVYKAKAQVYEIQLRAEMAKVEIYKAQIEAALGAVKMNEVTVKIYSEKIQAEIAKFTGRLEGNKLLVQIFSEEVRASLAEAQIEESKIKLYGEQIRAVLAQAEVYRIDMESFAKEIEAEKTKIEANVAVVDVYKKKADVTLAKYQAALEKQKNDQIWTIAQGEYINKVNDIEIRKYSAESQVGIEEIKLLFQNNQYKYGLMLEAAKAIAQATSTMAAGAMAAINADASLRYDEYLDLTKET
jgi:hypothetical protein